MECSRIRELHDIWFRIVYGPGRNRPEIKGAGIISGSSVPRRTMAMQRTYSVSLDSISFRTKEGTYRKGAFQYCRETRKAHMGKELTPVTVSFVSCKDKEGTNEWITFNSAREFYFYPFYGMRKYPDLTKPSDKRTYRSPTIPSCHDFNMMTRSTEKLDLILGFSTGPLQHVNPISRRSICAFNDDCSIDRSRVTCVKWVPGSETQFVSSHRSGNLYVWSTAFTGKATGPVHFLPHAELQDATISTVKSKHKSPLLYRWSIGHGAVNGFAFSPDSEHIAVASQDGFMRIYHFKNREFHSRMRSYFGGITCICWSPDGCYVVTGGEDDLVTVWSFHHRRVVARGEGHQSYVTAVAFDPYTTVLPESSPAVVPRQGNEDTNQVLSPTCPRPGGFETSSAASSPFLGRLVSEAGEREVVAYRLGSTGQDGQLCLWDLSEDALKIRRPFGRTRSRPSRLVGQPHPTTDSQTSLRQRVGGQDSMGGEIGNARPRADTLDQELHKPLTDTIAEKDRRQEDRTQCNAKQSHGASLAHNEKQPKVEEEGKQESGSKSEGSRDKDSGPNGSEQSDKKSKKGKDKSKTKNGNKVNRGQQRSFREPVKRVMRIVGVGSPHHNGRREVSAFETCNSDDIAPKMDEVNLIEPLVAERVDQERLSDLVFRDDCIVVASYDGLVSLWARPGVQISVDRQTEEEVESQQQATTAQSDQPEPHPGLNSPRPGGGPNSPLKQTTV